MPETMTVRERREVGAFRAVELRYFGHLHLSQGPTPGVEVEGDPDVVAKVHARVAGDALILEIGESWLDRLTSGVLLIAHRPLHYHVTVPELDRVAVTGTGKVEAAGLVTSDLEVTASGAADVTISGLEAHALKAQISGRGSFRLAGKAEAFELRISGSGEVEAADLACASVDVRISGQGTTTVRAAKRLDVKISGLGTVRYHGDPTVTQTISGSGNVTQVDAG